MLKPSADDIKKILLIRLSSLGDVLLTTQAIGEIRKRWPNAQIDYLTKPFCVPMIEYHSDINQIFKLPIASKDERIFKAKIKANEYDLIVDWQSSLRSLPYRKLGKQFVRFEKYRIKRFAYIKFNMPFKIGSVPERYLKSLFPLGVKDSGSGLKLVIPANIQQQIRAKVSTWKKPDSKLFFIAPGSKHFTKKYPTQYLTELIQRLQSVYPTCQVLLLGSSEDLAAGLEIKKTFSGKSEVWNAIGAFQLLETAALMEICDAGFSNDSLLMHMATALRIPVTAFFGSTTLPLGFGPYRSPHLVIEDNSVSCRPCTHIGKSTCPKKHFYCMLNLTPEKVWPDIHQFLQKEFN